MEESLFRGLFLTAFRQKTGFLKANLYQALLFAAWHLVWPLKAFLTGQQSLAAACAASAVILPGTGTFGFVWGYMRERSGSLWTPIAAHFTANTIQNLLHIQASDGLDTLISVRGAAASITALAITVMLMTAQKRHSVKTV